MLKFINRVLEAEEQDSYASSEVSIALDKLGINQDDYDVNIDNGKVSISIGGLSYKNAQKVKEKLPSLISSVNITSMNQSEVQEPKVIIDIVGHVAVPDVKEKQLDSEVTEDEPIGEEIPEESNETAPSDKIVAQVESDILDQYPDIETLRVEESPSVAGTIIIEGKTDPVTFKGIINLLKSKYSDYTVIGTNAYSYTTGVFQSGLVPN